MDPAPTLPTPGLRAPPAGVSPVPSRVLLDCPFLAAPAPAAPSRSFLAVQVSLALPFFLSPSFFPPSLVPSLLLHQDVPPWLCAGFSLSPLPLSSPRSCFLPSLPLSPSFPLPSVFHPPLLSLPSLCLSHSLWPSQSLSLSGLSPFSTPFFQMSFLTSSPSTPSLSPSLTSLLPAVSLSLCLSLSLPLSPSLPLRSLSFLPSPFSLWVSLPSLSFSFSLSLPLAARARSGAGGGWGWFEKGPRAGVATC